MHDPRVGRFFARDPLEAAFPWNSPYAFSENRVIDAVELEGLESRKIHDLKLIAIAYGEAITLKKSQIRAVSDNGLKKDLRKQLQSQLNSYSRVIVLLYKEAKSDAQRTALFQDITDKVKILTEVLTSTVHVSLDGIGLIPLIGELADGTNSVFYMAEGDYVNASLSAGACVPLLGWGSTGAKWTRKALKYSNNAFHSAGGLIYKQGSKHGNRLSHVLAHATDDLLKPKHGVFDVGDDVIGTIDDAWKAAQKGGDNVVKTVEGGRTTYVVDLGKKVGYEGGSKGSGEALNKVKIVVESETSNVVTAFPVK